MKNRFFFIKSTNKQDKGYLAIFTKTARQALAMAQIYYLKNAYVGFPTLMNLK